MNITCNPLFANEYSRKNISVRFDKNWECARIFDGLNTITVDASFFKDVVKVIDRAIENLTQQEIMGADVSVPLGEMTWNTTSTALSEPYDKDEFAELC